MNLTDTHNSGFNFFSKFRYVDWVHGEFQENHRADSNLEEYEMLLMDFGKGGLVIESAFAICWQQLKAVRVDYEAELNRLHREIEILEGLSSKGVITDSMLSEVKPKVEMSIRRVESIWPEKQEHNVQLLSRLVEDNRPDVLMDSSVLDTQAIVYAHLAIALALRLERLEKGHTERFWELLEDALRVIKMPRTEGISLWHNSDSRLMLMVETSLKLLEVLVYSYLFHKHFDDGKHERALEFLCGAISHSDAVDDKINNVLELDWEGPSILEWMKTPSPETPAIEVLGVGHHLVGLVVPMQKAADAFERTWDENSLNTDWKALSSMCWTVRFFCSKDYVPDDPNEYQVHSGVLLQRIDADQYWGMAELLASQRMSPSEFVEAQRKAEERKVRDRLRLYFFSDIWDNLPEKARACLISADREYEDKGGWRPSIFENLSLATRELLVQVLLKPYNEFCSKQKEIKSLAALAPVPSEYQDLYDTVQKLYYAPLFEDFLKQSFNSKDRKFIKGLEGVVRKLNPLRNEAVHDHRRTLKSFESDIRETYAEFIGINCEGILPSLMRLDPKVTTRPS